jgi:DNA-binding Lrp family transcriptional regulator
MEKDVYLALAEMECITETHALYGEYDLVARVQVKDGKELTHILMGELRTIAGIKETETLIVVEY